MSTVVLFIACGSLFSRNECWWYFMCLCVRRLLPWLLSHRIECHFHLILFFSQFSIFYFIAWCVLFNLMFIHIQRMAKRTANGNQGKARQHTHTHTSTQTKNEYCYHNAMGFFSPE